MMADSARIHQLIGQLECLHELARAAAEAPVWDNTELRRIDLEMKRIQVELEDARQS